MLSAGILVALLALASSAASGADPAAGTGVVRVNGVSIALERRVLEGEPEALAARLGARWGERLDVAARGLAPVSRPRLGRQRGPFHETVTLSHGPRPGTSVALVAVQDLRLPPAPQRSPPLPLPPGLKVVNVVEFGAARSSPAAFTLDTPAPPARALEALGAAARRGGWLLAAVPRSAGAQHARWARRAGSELAMVAIPRGAGSRVTVLLTPVAGGPAP
jgi:hypothetical protein